MSASTFRELLSKPTDEVERPRLLADGHYIGEIQSHEFGVSRNKQTPYVRFYLVPSEETADVPEGANIGLNLGDEKAYRDYYITPKSLFMLSDMLDAVLGKQAGRSFDERIPETRGARVMFAVGHRDNEDATRSYYEIGTIVAA